MTGKTAGDLKFKISYDTEADYDFVVVEAHTVGQDDWTTLAEVNGGTGQNEPGASCDINWDDDPPVHRPLPDQPARAGGGDEDCTPTGTTGAWNAATGNSGGFQDWKVDLSAYAGKQVEVSITYVQDFAVHGLGVFVDDASVTTDGRWRTRPRSRTTSAAGPARRARRLRERRPWQRHVGRLQGRRRRRHGRHALLRLRLRGHQDRGHAERVHGRRHALPRRAVDSARVQTRGAASGRPFVVAR